MNFIHFLLLLARLTTAFVTPPLTSTILWKEGVTNLGRDCRLDTRSMATTAAAAVRTITTSMRRRTNTSTGTILHLSDGNGSDNDDTSGSKNGGGDEITAVIQGEQQYKQRSEAEWKRVLSPQQYYVLRQEGTERPWSSPLNDVKRQDGVFVCAGCGSPLFPASKKFESGTGWPSFYDPLDADSIDLSVDYKLIVPRVEVSCKTCGGHLGHVFDDGPRPTGKRYCINGVAMNFVEYDKDPDMAEIVALREQQGNTNIGGGGGSSEMGGKKNMTKIREPFMAVVPGLALDVIVAGLFLNVFFKSNDMMMRSIGGGGGGGGDGGSNQLFLDMLTQGGASVDQIVFQSVPLVIGIFYIVQALFKVKRLLP